MSDMTVPQAVRQLRELALSAACAAALRAAARLGVADALDDDPASVDEIARTVKADAGALRRLLRALASNGIFTEVTGDRFAHTDASRLLREDTPRGLRYTTLWATEPWTWELWPRLDEAVRAGRSVFGDLHDKGFFEYLHEDAPESAAVFDRAMTQASALSAQALAGVLDLHGMAVVADVGGGQGGVLRALLERTPALRGVLFDLPEVIANADPCLRPGGSLGDRVQLVAGDCRREVPVEADLYLLKNVLEWDDESTVATLRAIASSGRPGARVVIVENLIDGSPELRFTTAMDLLLLLNVGGRKHTRAGLEDLIGQAGLILGRVEPVNSYLHMFTCVVSA
ncbi:methyltransferase [Actinoplanes palleronii]|uniref:O-methyltransferase n=1 Tax=Actinoplanes palleronii TaxID=113570 RepID=A0ABQ4B176_9ACTN|nr:methyltransferase [Actinoplanes palleronii]GIE64419.1 O-methyltransferase [Actinoplanes palleronii]